MPLYMKAVLVAVGVLYDILMTCLVAEKLASVKKYTIKQAVKLTKMGDYNRLFGLR